MKLKVWEKALICAVLFTFILGFDASAEASELSGKLVRLHVVANSDTEADQTLKLQVRDAVLAELRPRLEGVSDAKAAREIISNSLTDLEKAAGEVIRENGFDYAVTATILKESFPTTQYDNFSLPAGEYLSLRVKIGEARGHNWWCVVFPPICDAGELEPETSAAIGLSDADLGLITQDTPGYTVKFKFIELIHALFELFK